MGEARGTYEEREKCRDQKGKKILGKRKRRWKIILK
jgi:hypothetical protein